MCGIAGILNLSSQPIPQLQRRLQAMNDLQRHRGPDGEGIWHHQSEHIGFAHRRLSIIDLRDGSQPMSDCADNHAAVQIGNLVVFNGAIYNYRELRVELGIEKFATVSDTEVILHAYRKWGAECVNHFRGMFAFALWDEANQTLFCARDRFGIKPFCYTVIDQTLYFASEAKALLPFVSSIETDLEAFKEYLTFQFCLSGKTLFKNIHELQPGHTMRVARGVLNFKRYWNISYNPDFNHSPEYFKDKLRALLSESINLHLRSDVPVGAYLSGGLDSSIVASLASRRGESGFPAFTGKFSQASYGADYDESFYAREVARHCNLELFELEISASDFLQNIENVIYHLDYPVAGPGSFPQYMVSRLARQHCKVALGGQGGDEIFGGYARYLIVYLEQCVKAAVGRNAPNNENFDAAYKSLGSNLTALHSYKPLLEEFLRDGEKYKSDEMDKRYFRLINRASSLGSEINWELLGDYSPYETFRVVYYAEDLSNQSNFDRMTHFDFNTLLPALLHVEDRVSMAHGLESRVPLLDHPLVELAAAMPANLKLKDGELKYILRSAMRDILPPSVADRKDKMGFPVPFAEWTGGEARSFINDLFSSRQALERELVNGREVLKQLETEPKFGRKIWGLMCLELWQRTFHDKASSFKQLVR